MRRRKGLPVVETMEETEVPFRERYAELRARADRLFRREKPRRNLTASQRIFVASKAFSTSEETLWRQRQAAEAGTDAPAPKKARRTPLTVKRKAGGMGRPAVLEENGGDE